MEDLKTKTRRGKERQRLNWEVIDVGGKERDKLYQRVRMRVLIKLKQKYYEEYTEMVDKAIAEHYEKLERKFDIEEGKRQEVVNQEIELENAVRVIKEKVEPINKVNEPTKEPTKEPINEPIKEINKFESIL